MFIPRSLQFASKAFLLSLLMVVSWPERSMGGAIADVPKRHSMGACAEGYKCFYLWHRASNGLVQMTKRTLRTKHTCDYSFLKTKSVDFNSTFTIQGQDNNLYLCFNNSGYLKTRYQFNKSQCTFHERMDERNYMQLWQGNWAVGFNKKGRPQPGDMSKRKKPLKFYQFLQLSKSQVRQNWTKCEVSSSQRSPNSVNNHPRIRHHHSSRRGRPSR